MIVKWIQNMIGRRVRVMLKNRRTLTGRLIAYDEKMNIALMEATEPYKNEKLTLYPLAIIRGNSILSIQEIEEVK